jgi:hypothetical protein
MTIITLDDGHIGQHILKKKHIFKKSFIERCVACKTASVVWWSEFLATDTEVWVRFLALPDFLRSSESTQPHEYI